MITICPLIPLLLCTIVPQFVLDCFVRNERILMNETMRLRCEPKKNKRSIAHKSHQLCTKAPSFLVAMHPYNVDITLHDIYEFFFMIIRSSAIKSHFVGLTVQLNEIALLVSHFCTSVVGKHASPVS